MGFFDDTAGPVPEPLWRHHHPWDPPEAEFPGIVPIGTTLLGRSDQAAVAITGLTAFSNGFEIQLTARSRPGERRRRPGLEGGRRHSFRFGLQLPDGDQGVRPRTARPSGPRRDRDEEPAGPGPAWRSRAAGTPLRVPVPVVGLAAAAARARWSSWPSGPTWGSPETRAASTRGMILDAARAASGSGRRTGADARSARAPEAGAAGPACAPSRDGQPARARGRGGHSGRPGLGAVTSAG